MTTKKKIGILVILALIVAELFLTWYYPFSMNSFNKSVTYQPDSITRNELSKHIKTNKRILLKQQYQYSQEAKKFYSFLEERSQKKEETLTMDYLSKIKSELKELDQQYEKIYEKESSKPHPDEQTLSSLKNLHEGLQQRQEDIMLMMSPSIKRKSLKTLYGNFYTSLNNLERFTFRWYKYVHEQSNKQTKN
ncbi:hypothetical protein A374_15693 [Fictibacillus macauensis ZFHKF-1]|uniref:Uncharacterized protein n=1 Tax=Fictibacillus macauensis ZFHKF-1 TaxID=1196324 RepID=I8UBR9_9BACL|nr:hypothetical protein [Fictibacillus macauensis]EIT84243.1 hypothetical protein A374_15693 [Fictibacillus macauensis ZFHKF-1]